MAHDPQPAPILIRDPLTLLYWLFFRPQALDRYLHSTDDRLDRDLRLWQVSPETILDPRLRALAQARQQLLLLTSLFAVLSGVILVSVFGARPEWFKILLFATSYFGGTLLGDVIHWKSLPQSAGWTLRYSLVLFAVLIVIIYFTPANSLSLPYTIVRYMTVGVVLGMFGVGIPNVLFSVFLGFISILSVSLFDASMDGFVKLAIVCISISMLMGLLSSANNSGLLGGLVTGAILSSVYALATFVVVNLNYGIFIWLASFAFFNLMFLRLPFYLLWEMPVSFWLGRQARYSLKDAVRFWHKQPLHYDELIPFPLPGLPEHLAAIARQDPEMCKNALADVQNASNQQGVILKGLGLILTEEIKLCATIAKIARFREATNWLLLEETPKIVVTDYKASGISPQLLAALRSTILQTNKSWRSTRELFIDARLSPWRHSIPETASLANRVDVMIDFLHEEYTAEGENALVLFLRVLADQSPGGNDLRLQLTALASLLERELTNSINSKTEITALNSLEYNIVSVNFLQKEEEDLLRKLQSISTDAEGAMLAQTYELREALLHELVTQLKKQRLALDRSNNTRLRKYAIELGVWQGVLEREVTNIAKTREAIGELPMHYIAGAVLERGSIAFQGREDLFRALERLLINQTSRITPLLLGQPRTGKSSVLKQFPVRLGAQVLPVYLDMERRTGATTVEGLLGDIISIIRQEAQKHPEPISLPPLDEDRLAGDPYRVFENWIEEVERALGARRWLLLALDEFNRIDEAVRAGRMDERIFFLLRSLIQHHPQVVLALSGTFSLDECDLRWYEALKSVRNLPVSFLRPEEARRVFTKPAPAFPDDVYSEEAIERALFLTGGQPFLVHLLGETLINRYNFERATLPPGTPPGTPLPARAIDEALPEVLTGGETFFGSLWRNWILPISGSPAQATALLSALAKGEPLENAAPSSEQAALLALFVERDLLAPDERGGYAFRVPLVAEWIRRQRRLPTMMG